MKLLSGGIAQWMASIGAKHTRLILYASVICNVSFVIFLMFQYSGTEIEDVVLGAQKHIAKPLISLITGENASVKYGEAGQITLIKTSLEKELVKKLQTVDFTKGQNWLLDTDVKQTEVKVKFGDYVEFRDKKNGKGKPAIPKGKTPPKLDHLGMGGDSKQSEDTKPAEDKKLEVAVDGKPALLKRAATRVDEVSSPKPLKFDIRVTLALYLHYIRTEFEKKNPTNVPKSEKVAISVPFTWSDWVDLTYLNRYIALPEAQKPTCEWLNSQAWNGRVSRTDYCVDSKDIPLTSLKRIGVSTLEELPGLTVIDGMDEPFTEEARLIMGKSHLLTFSPRPFNVIFLAPNGSYEVNVNAQRRREALTSFLIKYASDNKIKVTEDTEITLDPAKEFQKLLDSVYPRPPRLNTDGVDFDHMLQNNGYEFSLDPKTFHVSQKDFDNEVEVYQGRMSDIRKLSSQGYVENSKFKELSLSVHEYSYYEALLHSKKFNAQTMPRYFHLARLTHKTKENPDDTGWHYEWRFFDGRLKYAKEGFTLEEMREREKIVLHRLVRNWFRFQYQRGIVSWLTHGGLLAWYWGGMSFPYDIDQDVQMPVQELIRFAKNYNQTLVVEDLNEGFGRFFIDVNTFVPIREAGNKMNNIDARFIDVDTGLYIDITGLAKTKEPKPKRYLPLLGKESKTSIKALDAKEIYNCREPQFYHISEISPLRYSLYEGVPMLIPRDVKGTMEIEYSKKAVDYPYYDGHFYVKHLRLWIREAKLLSLLEDKKDELLTREGDVTKVNVDAMIDEIENLSDAQVLQLLDDEGIFKEFYLTHDVTMLHEREKAVGSPHTPKMDAEMKEKYANLVSTFTKQKAFRKPLFQYQQIERLEHQEKPKKKKKGKKTKQKAKDAQ
ncbi:unnamed protein product [Kuraishia capsulata CBS 1993]|uniref:LicD/FKTN/FKRP nucleotidyltransferase domain-containing protein n=1 Tax=Kuraishia capsulata CBS 1993 TaxID=1382522 RepID=W6MXK6_9ASCO|nr:uncharacterized protein KUCA_T00005042001 [Kuraishia capsulata CBS 1993]CDK29055.1 unnamed protein product [Kuraishia capsulata CBS 1993]